MKNQGDLSSAVQDLLTKKEIKRCVVGKLLDDLVDPDLKALTTLLASDVSNSKVCELLNNNGYVIGETAIWKHRTNHCPCVRPS